MSKASLHFSELTGNVYWGRTNGNGLAIGEKRDVTSEFLQVMEMKFPVNTTQIINVNGKDKYRVIAVDLTKEVIVNGKVIQQKGGTE